MTGSEEIYVGPLDQVPTDPVPPPESDQDDAKPPEEPPRADA